MTTLINKAQATAAFVKARILQKINPRIAIILGSGLGRLAEEMKEAERLSYNDIPHFPVSTVEGHKGQLIAGLLEGVPVLCMQGRFHYYEGYDMAEVTYPIRVMCELDVDTLIVSNAAGGLNPAFSIGDLMLITDHINHFPANPLRGRNSYGDRFPDMSQAYDRTLIDIARNTSVKGIREGVYVGTQGPSFETPAELRMFRAWGADAVGMSTVPEVIVARHCNMRVLGISCITNTWNFEAVQEATHEEVQIAADSAAPRMTSIVKAVIKSIHE